MKSFNRRNFLIGTGVATAGLAFAGSPLSATCSSGHIEMLAEGIGNAIVASAPPPLPPGLEVRARHTCPSAFDGGKLRRNLMEVHIYLSPPSPDLPLANPPQPKSVPDGPTISLFYLRIDETRFAKTPRLYPWGNNPPLEFKYEFLLSGIVVAHPVVANPSPVGPFGNLVGRPLALAGGFDKTGDQTTFVMLGGMGAGDHVTMCIGSPDDLRPNGTALGTLKIR
jgi:hypothetical protein